MEEEIGEAQPDRNARRQRGVGVDEERGYCMGLRAFLRLFFVRRIAD